MKQAKEVLLEELKDSIKSKRIIFILLIASLVIGIVFASNFLQVLYLMLFSPKNSLPLMVSITYYLLFITIPFFTLLLGYDSVSGEIENSTTRGVISKIKRDSFIIGKFLSVFIIVSALSILLIIIAAIYSFKVTTQYDIMHTLLIIGYLMLYTGACTAVTIFFSSILSRNTTSLFIVTIFHSFMQYLNMGSFGYLTLFHYFDSAISFENIYFAVLTFAAYLSIFIFGSVMAFRVRDL
jgi:ABC-type transport system involved in multi-copper enzyme maturation permease subunit